MPRRDRLRDEQPSGATGGAEDEEIHAYRNSPINSSSAALPGQSSS
jgi:hypothetical protein